MSVIPQVWKMGRVGYMGIIPQVELGEVECMQAFYFCELRDSAALASSSYHFLSPA